MNPFSRVKDAVVIEMMKEIIKKKRKQPEKVIEEMVFQAYNNLKQEGPMKSYKELMTYLDSRPAFNNPKDDNAYGMNDKLQEKQKKKTIYGGGVRDLKKRMNDAYKRNQRQKKIDKLQSTNQWQGLE